MIATSCTTYRTIQRTLRNAYCHGLATTLVTQRPKPLAGFTIFGTPTWCNRNGNISSLRERGKRPSWDKMVVGLASLRGHEFLGHRRSVRSSRRDP